MIVEIGVFAAAAVVAVGSILYTWNYLVDLLQKLERVRRNNVISPGERVLWDG